MLASGKHRPLFRLLKNASLRILSQNAAEVATPATNSFSSNSSSSAAATAQSSTATTIPNDGLTLDHFINQSRSKDTTGSTLPPSILPNNLRGSVFIETYGCQMNVNDSEVVHSVLQNAGYSTASSAETADVVLLNTCAIRENAESKIWQRLGYFKNMKLERKNKAITRRPAAGAGAPSSSTAIRNTFTNNTATTTNKEAKAKVNLTSGPVVGVLGCMAERLKIKLLESDRLVDLVAGPDAYRDLPRLIDIVDGGVSSEKARKKRRIVNISSSSSSSSARSRKNSNAGSTGTTTAPTLVDALAEEHQEDDPLTEEDSSYNAAINVQLSLDETYADVIPIRPAGAQSVFLSIMRGCNNMCSFCVVPFTRGRERSRPMNSILDEVRMLSDQGVKEITLLGQNVNSYADFSSKTNSTTATTAPSIESAFDVHYAKGFQSVYRPHRQGAISFAELLDQVADINPEMRIRFTSPHPKEFSDDVLRVLLSRDNVCKQLHMPAQSGSTAVLERMKRGYTREAYDALVDHIRAFLPGVALSTDMIAGFCEETEQEHKASVDLLKKVKYDLAFLFAYSEREKTHAARNYADNVLKDVKIDRVSELIDTYRQGVYDTIQEEVGRRHLVLVEGPSKKYENQFTGRTDTFKRVVFEDCSMNSEYRKDSGAGDGAPWVVAERPLPQVHAQPGDYVAVQVVKASGGTLHAVPLGRTSIKQFVEVHGSAVPLEKYR